MFIAKVKKNVSFAVVAKVIKNLSFAVVLE
jgi:hypothetical protein